MDSIEEHFTGAKAFKESQKSMINLISKDEIRAFGNLVLFNKTVFVVTAKHSIYYEIKDSLNQEIFGMCSRIRRTRFMKPSVEFLRQYAAVYQRNHQNYQIK